MICRIIYIKFKCENIIITSFSIIQNLGITCNLSKMLVLSSIIIIYVITYYIGINIWDPIYNP